MTQGTERGEREWFLRFAAAQTPCLNTTVHVYTSRYLLSQNEIKY